MKKSQLFILTLVLLFTLPLYTVPASAEAGGGQPAETMDGMSAYCFDALDPQNVAEVETGNADGLTRVRVFLQDGVFAEDEMTFQMSYTRNWSTESGILANARVDLDGDGQEERLVLYSESLTDAYGGYTQECVAAFENIGGDWIKQAEFVIGHDMMSPYSDGPRLRTLRTSDGIRLACVEFGMMDGGHYLAKVTMYAYDGQTFFKAATAQMDDYSASFLYKGRMPAEVDDEMANAPIYSAADEYAYLQAHYEGHGTLIEHGTNGDAPNCSGFMEIGALLAADGLTVSYSVSDGYVSAFDIAGGDDFFCVTKNMSDGRDVIELRMATELNHFAGGQTDEKQTRDGSGAGASDSAEADFAFEPCEGGCMITEYLGAGGTVRIPETLGGMAVVGIDERAFGGNETVREIDLPASLESIGKSAFYSCTALERVELNDGLKNIREWAFSKCTALTRIVIPESVEEIGESTFSGCKALQTIVMQSLQTKYDRKLLGLTEQVVIEYPATPAPITTPVPTATPAPIMTPVPTPVPDVDGVDLYAGQYTLGRSSVRKGNDFDVSAGKAVDGNLGTAWNAHDKGKGEWISFMMPSGKACCMAGFRIVNGYVKNNTAYTENTRVRTLDLYCDGVYVESFTLSDDRALQTYWLTAPVVGREFRMVATDVYSGSRYRDLSITEVELLGANNEDFHTRDLSGWGRAVDLMAQKLYDGGSLKKGSYGYDVMGLQVLLDRGFGVLKDVADGSFGGNTEAALNTLMNQMRASSAASSMEPMRDGVADAAFLRNLLVYIQSR